MLFKKQDSRHGKDQGDAQDDEEEDPGGAHRVLDNVSGQSDSQYQGRRSVEIGHLDISRAHLAIEILEIPGTESAQMGFRLMNIIGERRAR